MSEGGPISQSDLKKLVTYEPETGLLKWIDSPARNVKAGSVAGSVNKADGYVKVKIRGKLYLAHRLAVFYMTGVWPDHTDHANAIRSDNRWSNLRSCSSLENAWNKSKQHNNTSGCIGVTWCKRSMKWKPSISVKGKRISLGYWDDVELADLIAREAREKYHGEYANHGYEVQE